jgi:hypothetical protein
VLSKLISEEAKLSELRGYVIEQCSIAVKSETDLWVELYDSNFIDRCHYMDSGGRAFEISTKLCCKRIEKTSCR